MPLCQTIFKKVFFSLTPAGHHGKLSLTIEKGNVQMTRQQINNGYSVKGNQSLGRGSDATFARAVAFLFSRA